MNRAELPAVEAEIVRAGDEDFVLDGIDTVDTFDQRAVDGMAQDDDISRFESRKQEGDVRRNDEIPLQIRRRQAFAGNFKHPQHYRLG